MSTPISAPSFSLEGKVAIVTGARRGMGKEIALTFAEAGADVAICDVVVEGGELEAVAKEIQGLGRRSLAMQTDISKKVDVDNLVQRTMDEFGVIDILVNNAGITGDRLPILESSEENYDSVLNTNLKGYFLCSQAVGKRMVERGKGGEIINIASIFGVEVGDYGRKVETDLGVYSISKAGVVMLTRVLASELGSYNIRVNAIAPTRVLTPMSLAWDNPGEAKRSSAYIPLGRIAYPDDIAAAALFLASDASRYISGDTLLLEGGQLA